jgi:hypothetical protein
LAPQASAEPLQASVQKKGLQLHEKMNSPSPLK